MFLSSLSIKRPVLVSMVLAALIVFGIVGFLNLPLELFPEVNAPYITVTTAYPGASPADVESQITTPIEDQVSAIGQIDYIQSYSMDNVSLVLVVFKLGKDADIARQDVSAAVERAANTLPDDAQKPTVEKLNLAAAPVVNLLVTGNMKPTQLHDIASNRISDQIAQIQGVGRVNLIGGQQREIHVTFDNRVLFTNSVTLAQVMGYLKGSNLDMPSGSITAAGSDYGVRMEGTITGLDQLRSLEIPTASGRKRLDRLAAVSDNHKKVRERITYFDVPAGQGYTDALRMSVIKTPDANTTQVVSRVLDRVKQLRNSLPAGVQIRVVSEEATQVKNTVNDTLWNIITGIGFTALILLLFLHDIRSTFIVMLTMPLSIVPTFLVLNALGITLNLLSLMGLATAVGVLVMNSVIVLENIFRHKEAGHGRKEAADRGTSEIAVAVIASTLTNIAVFLPIANMSGIFGQIIADFAVTVAIATVFSLLISFTMTPMLAALILPDQVKRERRISRALEAMFKRWEKGYHAILERVLKRRLAAGVVLLVAVAAFIGSMMLASFLSVEFAPVVDSGKVNITVELPQGTPLATTQNTVDTIEKRIRTRSDVKSILATVGRISDTQVGTNRASINVNLIPVEKRKSNQVIASAIIRTLSDIPNATIQVQAVSSFQGGQAPVSFFLYGDNLKKLESISGDLTGEMDSIPGLVNVSNSLEL